MAESRTVHLYGWGHETDPRRHPGRDDDMTSIGAANYGARYDTLIIHPVARTRINEAVRIVEWCHQFTCRFQDPPHELLDLLKGL